MFRRVVAAAWVGAVVFGVGAGVAKAGPILYYTDGSSRTAEVAPILDHLADVTLGATDRRIAASVDTAPLDEACAHLTAIIATGGPGAALFTAGGHTLEGPPDREARRPVIDRILSTEVPEPGVTTLLGVGLLALARQRLLRRYRAS